MGYISRLNTGAGINKQTKQEAHPMNIRYYAMFIAVLFASATFAQKPYGQFEYVSPMPGTKTHTPETNIIVRHGDLIDKTTVDYAGGITVIGERSGAIDGEIKLSTDGKTIVFNPTERYAPGEKVTVYVNTPARTVSGERLASYSFEFEVAETPATFVPDINPYDYYTPEELGGPPPTTGPRDYDANPTIVPPPTLAPDTLDEAKVAPGYIFTATWPNPLSDTTSAYLLIIDNEGTNHFERYIGAIGTDFRITKTGNPVYMNPIAYDPTKPAFIPGEWIIMDTTFAEIDTIQMGNGYIADSHDFRLLPNGHSLMHSSPFIVVDMTDSVEGGRPDALVKMEVVQEVDADDNVIFQWRSWDYLPLSITSNDMTNPFFQHMHLNSVMLDRDGHIIVCARLQSANYKLNRQTGEVMWAWGGQDNEFTFLDENPEYEPDYFSRQHDIHRLENGNIILFDNGNSHDPPVTRIVEYELDETAKTARLIWSWAHPERYYSWAMGGVQRLPNGNTLIGWGAGKSNDPECPVITEVTPEGEIVFEASFEDNSIWTYRSFRFPFWHGLPIAEVLREVFEGNQYTFNDPNDTTGVTILLNDIPDAAGGYQFFTVTREKYAPLAPEFSGKDPLISPYRINVEHGQTGAFNLDFTIDMDYYPLAYGLDSAIVYTRETKDEGLFIPLATTYNASENTLLFTATSIGEFIIGRPDFADQAFAPQRVRPAEGASVDATSSVELEWRTVGFAGTYDVQVATDAGFSNLVLDETGLTTTSTELGSLTEGETYHWKVSQTNGAGTEWSDVGTFVAEAPYIDVLAPNGDVIFSDTSYYIVSWDDNMSDLVTLDLYEGGTLYTTIVDSFANVHNKYRWTPADTIPSGNYILRVASVERPSIFGESPAAFTYTNGVERIDDQTPDAYSLAQNYPNPFNPTTTIEFSLPEATTARVAIYDMLGREVAVLADGRMTAGMHSVEFDASALASGVYI
ncbi:MAG: T9SS type A sorting domain-containing protein, partial [Ignavibacteriales bacterium]|nr:T9SS type A sorting domain-containing protein [Ignavibacteriales bacterium]